MLSWCEGANTLTQLSRPMPSGHHIAWSNDGGGNHGECMSQHTIISAIMYRIEGETIYTILYQVCMRLSAAIPEPNGCRLVHTDAQCCILMHTNACILMHAGET